MKTKTETEELQEKLSYVSKQLEGIKLGESISGELKRYMQKHKLVAFMGDGYTLVQLKGYLSESLMIREDNTVTVYLDKEGGILVGEVERKDKKGLIKVKGKLFKRKKYRWTFDTNVQHAAFDVETGYKLIGDKYARGIVVSLESVGAKIKAFNSEAEEKHRNTKHALKRKFKGK